MRRLILLASLCLVATTALAADDAGPTDGYTDGTTIHEDW